MQKPVAVITLANPVSPPAHIYTASIRKNLLDYFLPIVTVRQDGMTTPLVLSTAEGMLMGLELNEATALQHADASLTACLFPTFSEFEGETISEMIRLGIVYTPIRNKRGVEWIFYHVIGAPIVPPVITAALENIIFSVMMDRNSFENTRTPEETEVARRLAMKLSKATHDALAACMSN